MKFKRLLKVPKISELDLSLHVKDIQALFINIIWKTGNKKNGIPFEEFRNLNLSEPSIMRNGIIFIWVDKEIMGDLMHYMDSMKFTYIENFTIIHLSMS